jgi:lipid-A-disaccharide synthase
VLGSLPFEARWFAEQGCQATFVGHPFFDEVRRQPIDEAFLARHRDPARPLVTLLPGSRTQEVEHNLRYFLAAAAKIQAQVPQARFAIASFKPSQAQRAREAVARSGLPIEVFLRRTPELIHLADCCLAVSGSVSLELLYHTKPTAILYWISPLAYAIQRRFRRVKYITLVNLLVGDELFPADTTPYDPERSDADQALFPEYLTCEDKSSHLARHVVQWLTDAAAKQRLIDRLAALKTEVAHGGASSAAARYILEVLARSARPLPQPHLVPHPAAATQASCPAAA